MHVKARRQTPEASENVKQLIISYSGIEFYIYRLIDRSAAKRDRTHSLFARFYTQYCSLSIQALYSGVIDDGAVGARPRRCRTELARHLAFYAPGDRPRLDTASSEAISCSHASIRAGGKAGPGEASLRRTTRTVWVKIGWAHGDCAP